MGAKSMNPFILGSVLAFALLLLALTAWIANPFESEAADNLTSWSRKQLRIRLFGRRTDAVPPPDEYTYTPPDRILPYVPPSFCPAPPNATSYGIHKLDPHHLPSPWAAYADPVSCYWTNVTYVNPDRGHESRMTLLMCTHDPKIDLGMSGNLHTGGAHPTPPDEVKMTHRIGACSDPRRPVYVDVGANIGAYALGAAGRGCHVIAFEPSPANMGRLIASARANGWLDRFTFFANGVGGPHSQRRAVINHHDGNSGTSSVTERAPGFVSTADATAIDIVTLDEIFFDRVHEILPRLPSGKTIGAGDVAFLKVDVEGHDAAALAGASRLLQTKGADGRGIPALSIEFVPSQSRWTTGCAPGGMLRWLANLNFTFALNAHSASPLPPWGSAEMQTAIRVLDDIHGGAPGAPPASSGDDKWPRNWIELWFARDGAADALRRMVAEQAA